MNPSIVYERLMAAMAQPPEERHQLLARLHGEGLNRYLAVLNHLAEDDAQKPLPDHPDQRTAAQIVGHIAAWDRFAVLSAGDMLAGIQHPRMITDINGYREEDGTTPAFASIDDFNAYHVLKYGSWSWDRMRHFAEDMAATLYTLFSHPQLLSASRLEQTKPYQKRLQDGTLIRDITMGWNLWLTMIEHLAVEHADLLDHFQ